MCGTFYFSTIFFSFSVGHFHLTVSFVGSWFAPNRLAANAVAFGIRKSIDLCKSIGILKDLRVLFFFCDLFKALFNHSKTSTSWWKEGASKSHSISTFSYLSIWNFINQNPTEYIHDLKFSFLIKCRALYLKMRLARRNASFINSFLGFNYLSCHLRNLCKSFSLHYWNFFRFIPLTTYTNFVQI